MARSCCSAAARRMLPSAPPRPAPSAAAAQQALDILKQHDEGFGPASAIAATRLASTLLATGNPQEAQVGGAGSVRPAENTGCSRGSAGRGQEHT